MIRLRLLAVLILATAVLVAILLYPRFPFKLGLDLAGGSQLVYEADVSVLAETEIDEAMSALREVIERRIASAAVAGTFGVLEPVIQVEQSGLGAGAKHRLLVELPGITDLGRAREFIQKTPLLEFKVERESGDLFAPTKLTGRFLKRAQVEFAPQALGPSISVEFNREGADFFAELTKTNVGRRLGIFLDGELLSAPVVREPILAGRAEITGQFVLAEAQALVRNLNLGALPVPIVLVSTETIGPALGAAALTQGVRAGWLGLALVAVLLLSWYRLPGLVAVVALALYIILMLTIFKLVPVTITAAAMAGFILSLGIAVDANILIFERLKEELRAGQTVEAAIREGFRRAWLSIRDSNLSTLISALILFWFGTAFLKGFALTLSLGVIFSMLTAITVSRTFLLALGAERRSRLNLFLFGSGFR